MKESQSLLHLNRRLISEWGETQHINSVLAGHSANKAFYMLSKLALPCVLGRVYSRFIYIWVEDSVHEACSEMVRKQCKASSDSKSNVKPRTQVYFRFPWEKNLGMRLLNITTPQVHSTVILLRDWPMEGDLKGYLSGRSTRTFHTPPS